MKLENPLHEAPVPPAHDSALLTAADAAAWSLVALLIFCVLSFVLGAWVLKRREERQISAEPESANKAATAHDTPESSNPKDGPWSRDPDWWRQ